MDYLLQKRLWPIILYPRYCLDGEGNTLGKYTPGTSQWPLQNISVSLWWFSYIWKAIRRWSWKGGGSRLFRNAWVVDVKFVDHTCQQEGRHLTQRHDYDVNKHPLNIRFASNVHHLKTFFSTLNNTDLALPRWHKHSEYLWMFYTCLSGDARGWLG